MAIKEKQMSKEAETSTGMERHPIEKLQAETNVSDAVHAGACLRMGWNYGKEVTKEDYLRAVERFKGSSAGRSRHA